MAPKHSGAVTQRMQYYIPPFLGHFNLTWKKKLNVKLTNVSLFWNLKLPNMTVRERRIQASGSLTISLHDLQQHVLTVQISLIKLLGGRTVCISLKILSWGECIAISWFLPVDVDVSFLRVGCSRSFHHKYRPLGSASASAAGHVKISGYLGPITS